MYKSTSCGTSMYTPGVIPEELREQFGNACELVCVQVPKVYDSCLLRTCLVGDPDKEKTEDGIYFDSDLRVRIDCSADGIVNPRVIGLVPGSFKIISKKPVASDPDRKFISFTYQLKILYDVVFDDGTVSRDNELLLRRSETVGPLYCPDSKAIIRESKVDQSGTIHPATDEDDEIVKLEIIARVLDVQIERECTCTCDPYDDVCYAVFTVGIYHIIKCELIVQLVIPAFGFCPPPPPCERMGEACEQFNQELPPDFFPPQLDQFITGPGV
ncbi:hypothetical protein FQB35_06730 [Crassaminicella thermophila]|uniref:Uncharacterized protein n=1 Tax=Crassaminicella thermophila TaxID=2599308 RepID=A0A5C0SC08_CRATE|nr:hypothetical protein [Crassaminicella thermophila]QEK12093.1 hypothetical protein FQB35_06730 [Crassaminicella thermophila]